MNIVVYVVCSILGFLAGHFLPAGAWATYVSILVSYHLFLAWLVITAEHETGFSLPIFSTIITHLACLTVVVGLTVGRHYIPFFGLIRYFIPAMAPFERDWLFSGNAQKKDVKKKKVPVTTAVIAIPVHVAIAEATAEDHEAWIRHLAQPNRATRKPGLSVKDEYEHWLVARIGSRHAAVSRKSPV
jgi:hypothetical protein